MADFLIPFISAAAGLGGVFLGGWLTNLREREKRRTDHIERKLSEFYGPLMTLYKQLAARREHRQNVEGAINKVWERLAPEMRRVGIESQNISQDLASQLDALTEDDKKYLEEVFLPDFREMLRLFREKMWLAEASTLPYFETIVVYVDAWELSLRKVITGAVAIELQRPTEAKLRQFYSDLEATYDRLRRELTDVQGREGWSASFARVCQRWLMRLPWGHRAGG
jgi:hypothetical protein